MPVLATWSPEDALLGALAPLALAAAAGTALVVDLDPGGMPLPGVVTLSTLVAEGPTRSHLSPDRQGVAVLPNGGVGAVDAEDVVAALVSGWPSVVFRLPPHGSPRAPAGRVVPCRTLAPVPGIRRRRPAVYQRGPWRVDQPGPGIVLPVPRPGTVRALLAATIPVGDRWVRAWRRVWELPWR